MNMKTPIAEIAAALKGRVVEESGSVDFLPSSRTDAPVVETDVPTPKTGGVPPTGGLDELQALVASCEKCSLAATRTRTVFGEGATGCSVMFVGEGPGAEEDATGRPFVGPAGKLLDKMIGAMGLVREETYIANVVKCRPPGNANPAPDQSGACFPYLERQIRIVRPRFIVALGKVAALALTGRSDAIVRQRGRWHKWGDIPFVVTYHPAALLRDPSRKRLTWQDLQMVMGRLDRKAT